MVIKGGMENAEVSAEGEELQRKRLRVRAGKRVWEYEKRLEQEKRSEIARGGRKGQR